MKLTPRQKRLVACLLERPHSSFELISMIGSLNVPDVVFRLRKRGIQINCKQSTVKDRDGFTSRPGVYSIPESGRNKAFELIGAAGTAPIDSQKAFGALPDSSNDNTSSSDTRGSSTS